MKVRQLEEDVRRIAKEADIARLDMIRTKQVHQQQMLTMQQQIEVAKRQQSSTRPQHERMDLKQTYVDSGHKKGSTVLGEPSKNEVLTHRRASSDFERNENSNDKLKASGNETTDNTSQSLHSSDHRHLRKDLSIHRSSHATSLLLKQSLTKYKNINNCDPLNHRIEFIMSMITDIATTQSPNSNTLGNLVKEMIRALVVEFEIFSKKVDKGVSLDAEFNNSMFYEKKRQRVDQRPMRTSNLNSLELLSREVIISLDVLQTILQLFNDLLLLSSEARKELRACISSSYRLGSDNSQNWNSYSSSIRDPSRVMSRIRGLETSKGFIMGINANLYGSDVTRPLSCFIDEECRTLCTQLVAFISDILVGVVPSSISFRVETISFLLSIIIDVDPETSKSSLSDEMISWCVILHACFPIVRQNINGGYRDIINILESDLELQFDYARRRYKLLTEKIQSVSPDAALKNPFDFDSFQDAPACIKLEVISLKTVGMQLISTLINCSRSARDTIIHNTIPCGPESVAIYLPHVTHARRIMAAILDELQAFILPFLSVNKSQRLWENSLPPTLIPALKHCKQSVNLIRVLCEFDEGFELVRTRMKSLHQNDGSVKDTLPAISIIADCFIISGRVLARHFDDSDPTCLSITSSGRYFMSLMSVLLGEVLQFFKLCLSRVQHWRKLIDEGHKSKRELISFLSILCEADRKESFCSVCRTLLLATSNFSRGVVIEEDSHQIIMAILNEISFDEEDEKQ